MVEAPTALPDAHLPEMIDARLFQMGATRGISTRSGRREPAEADARFERGGDRKRYEGVARIAENLWDTELDELLCLLLQSVPWQEVLARACAVLVEGE